jgi:hypothetical protein
MNVFKVQVRVGVVETIREKFDWPRAHTSSQLRCPGSILLLLSLGVKGIALMSSDDIITKNIGVSFMWIVQQKSAMVSTVGMALECIDHSHSQGNPVKLFRSLKRCTYEGGKNTRTEM